MTVLGVIPTYNALDYARVAAQSFLDTTPDGLVLLVDDGSPDWKGYRHWRKWPQERVLKHRFAKNDRNLTRSWNLGLQRARELKVEHVVVTNSDVRFVPGWFDGIKATLDAGVDLVGPLTNAAGHRPKQRVDRYLNDYKLSDDVTYLAGIVPRLQALYAKDRFRPGPINGFCMVARTEAWWATVHDAAHVFNPKYKMTRNEDELQGRLSRAGRTVGIALTSFVFHYRGVSRRGGTAGVEGKGFYRRKG